MPIKPRSGWPSCPVPPAILWVVLGHQCKISSPPYSAFIGTTLMSRARQCETHSQGSPPYRENAFDVLRNMILFRTPDAPWNTHYSSIAADMCRPCRTSFRAADAADAKSRMISSPWWTLYDDLSLTWQGLTEQTAP